MSDSNLTQIGICNSALYKVGADPITSLADGSRAANILSNFYNVLRDEVMSQAPWRFALQQVQLSVPTVTPPPFGYNYAFPLPADCLRPLKVNDNHWSVIQGNLVCNSPMINLLYIQLQNGNEATWDPLFAETLSLRLAMEIALALVQSAPLQATMEKMYMEKIALARSTNAVVGTPERLVADQWSGARKGYYYFWPTAAGAIEDYGPVN